MYLDDGTINFLVLYLNKDREECRFVQVSIYGWSILNKFYAQIYIWKYTCIENSVHLQSCVLNRVMYSFIIIFCFHRSYFEEDQPFLYYLNNTYFLLSVKNLCYFDEINPEVDIMQQYIFYLIQRFFPVTLLSLLLLTGSHNLYLSCSSTFSTYSYITRRPTFTVALLSISSFSSFSSLSANFLSSRLWKDITYLNPMSTLWFESCELPRLRITYWTAVFYTKSNLFNKWINFFS